MSDAAVMIGQTLDRYRIVSKLGEGGMGVVYKARDEHLNRTVAVKVLPGDRVADPARKERFVREARAASALNHPGIVTIHDIRSEGGVDFILMEYVEGRTLSDLIAGLRHPQALKYAVQIADAMAGAHAAGILHRDLKPSNVMVTHDDRVKILDFGLAKLIEPKDSSPDSPTVPAHMLTLEGDVIGTAPYMSPEQAEGRKVDARSDIFSFGALLYEMVTGSRAFNGPSRLAILSRILTEEPTPPRQLVPALPVDLEKIILRCLRKEPNRRYQSMTDLKIALEDLAIESASERRMETPLVAVPSRRHWLWFLLALPLVIAAAFFTWRAWRISRPGESHRATALTTFAGVELDPSLSPDGNHVAFTWNGEKQDNTDVYVQMIGSGAPLRLTTDPRTEENPVWSPDGRWIAFLRFESIAPMSRSRGELRLIAPLGGPEQKLADIHTRRLEVHPRFHRARLRRRSIRFFGFYRRPNDALFATGRIDQ